MTVFGVWQRDEDTGGRGVAHLVTRRVLDRVAAAGRAGDTVEEFALIRLAQASADG